MKLVFASLIRREFVLIVILVGTLVSNAHRSCAQSEDAKFGVTPNRSVPPADCSEHRTTSPYIPVDSWMYPAISRLYSLGAIDHVYLGLRPWPRDIVDTAIAEATERIERLRANSSDGADEIEEIIASLKRERARLNASTCDSGVRRIRFESAYSIVRVMSGTPLHDSYHLGSSIVNDYGRPYEKGVNNYSGISAYASAGPLVLYVRGELQASPSGQGYSSQLAEALATLDQTPFLNQQGTPYNQSTIPLGPIGNLTRGKFLEAYAGVRVLGHLVSFGKQDQWLGPGSGGAMSYSNLAENIYAFEINRTDPLYVPFLSKATGPFRYEFLVGPLKGHIFPNSPWVHVEKVSFKPTANLEFGFERTVIWGGKGHAPITLHTFLRSFFSTTNVTSEIKGSREDPGARFSAFDFTYRLPFARNWVTLYADSEAHDDVSPISAPRRAAYRAGLYLAHTPGLPKLDIRAEGISTDPPSSRSNGGQFNYFEAIQKQGYTNNGQIFGDWIGREAKGGEAWITYHNSGNEWIQASFRRQKTAKDFIAGGTTLDDFRLQVVKRVRQEFEIRADFTYERWKAPLYSSGQNTASTATVLLSWYPKL